MGFLNRIRDEDAELIVAGRAPGGNGERDLDELAAFMTAARVAVPEQPVAGTEARLVPALASEAHASMLAAASAPTEQIGVPRPRPHRHRRALVAQLVAVVLLVPALLAGLAFAGVKLPAPARDAFEQVGLGLPNQEGGDRSSTDRASGKTDKSGSSGAKDGDGSDAGSTGAKQKAASKNGHGGSSKGNGGNGRQGSPPAYAGPTGIPPGQGGTPPGQGGTPPGQSSTPPGQGGVAPGQGGTIPGSGSGGQSAEPHGGGPPAGTPPGQAK